MRARKTLTSKQVNKMAEYLSRRYGHIVGCDWLIEEVSDACYGAFDFLVEPETMSVVPWPDYLGSNPNHIIVTRGVSERERAKFEIEEVCQIIDARRREEER